MEGPIELLPNKEPATPMRPFADAELGPQAAPDGKSMTPTEEGASPAKMHTVEPSDNLPAARRRTRTIVNLMDELGDLPATAENIMTFEQMTEKADRI